MDVRIEDAGPCRKVLHFQVPPELVRSKLDESYLELSQQVDIPGFRRGHVPRKLMEKRFGSEVNRDVHSTLMAELLEKALDEHSLKMVGLPEMPEASEELDVDNAMSFDVTVEVQPDIEIPDYSQFVLARPSEGVTEEDIEGAIERLRRRGGTYAPVADGQVQDDDLIVADLAISVDGSVIDRVEEANVRVNTRLLAGIACEGLPQAVRGARAGEARTVTAKLPQGYRSAEHEGKQAQIDIQIKEVKRLDLPEVSDEWAQSMHFGSLEGLREALRSSLGAEKRALAASELERQFCDRLVGACDFELPEGPVQRVAERFERRQRLGLQMRQVPEDQIEQELAKARQQAHDDAVRECKLFFLIEAIANDRRIFVTEDEVRQRVAQIASDYGRNFDSVRAEMARDGSMDDLRAMMRRDKTIQYALTRAQTQGEPAPQALDPAPPDRGDAPDEGPSHR